MDNFYQVEQEMLDNTDYSGVNKPVNEQLINAENHHDHSQNMLKPSEESKKNEAQNRKNFYAEIEAQLGKETADKWLEEEFKREYAEISTENQNYLQEIADKYQKYIDIPEINAALNDFFERNVNFNSSLKNQDISNALDHIVNIYMSGYNAAQGLKKQNDNAKSRMVTSINQMQPAVSRSKMFSRAEIRAMSPEEFSRNEKAIFEQMAKGLLK